MIFYLLFAALFVPVNIWAALTPHLHSELSMRLLHALSVLVLVPLLVALVRSWRRLNRFMLILLASFQIVMVVVNSWIVVNGMGVRFGWLDHYFLSLAAGSVIAFFLLDPAADAETA